MTKSDRICAHRRITNTRSGILTANGLSGWAAAHVITNHYFPPCWHTPRDSRRGHVLAQLRVDVTESKDMTRYHKAATAWLLA